MPKELTHWWLAAHAQTQLPLDSPTRRLLAAEQPAYLVGAVLPDTLLHLVFGPWSATALRLARDFHEPPENSYTPLVRFVEQQEQKGAVTPAVSACLSGVAAHIEADIIFHPYICSLSGNNIGLHYMYETDLDLWLLKGGKTPPVWRLKELLSDDVSNAVESVAQGLFDPAEELPRSAVRQALKLHGSIQGMYGSPGWQLLAKCLALLPIRSLRNRHKLFYPLGWQQGHHLIWPDCWTDPATGTEQHDTPKKLAAKAVERIRQMMCRVDEAGLLQALKEQPGENLITGVSSPPARIPTITCATAPQ